MAIPASGPLSLTDIQTEFGGSNPISLSEYYAGGGLVPAGTTGTYGAVPSSGAISVQNFYGTSNFIPSYIENVFSTTVYNGTGSAQTITNNINLSGSGGLVWSKGRQAANAYNNFLQDTVQGTGVYLSSNNANESTATSTGVTAFNSNGYTTGNASQLNQNGYQYVSWTFRKQAKFFDIVQYTGNATARTIAHNLGSVPMCIMVKDLTVGRGWKVYHVYTGENNSLILNSRTGAVSGSEWNSTAPTSSVFSIGNDSQVNSTGSTYIAYLFAGYGAGGFGLNNDQDVIMCGGFTTNSSGNSSRYLGWEPQFVMYKKAYGQGDWKVMDIMRQYETQYGQYGSNGLAAPLQWNTANQETENTGDSGWVTSTGFGIGQEQASTDFLYIAIRRGPMKIPTVGTSVYTPIYQTPAGGGTLRTVGFPADLMIGTYTAAATPRYVNTRLTGFANNSGSSQTTPKIASDSSGAEAFGYPLFYNVYNTTARDGDYIYNSNGINWLFGRAPNFFDVVCYRGNNVYNQAIPHNLAAVPELVIVKNRTTGGSYWAVYTTTTGSSNLLKLNLTNASASNPYAWGSTAASSTNFYVGDDFNTNNLSDSFVMYLFATCAGVSKVGSYTGTGALQTVNCGFTSGARFVLIKRTDSTGDWYVWDSARGISSGNDPYSLLNSASSQVTGTNYVDTTSVGFQVTAAAPAELNASGGTYFFLAIA